MRRTSAAPSSRTAGPTMAGRLVATGMPSGGKAHLGSARRPGAVAAGRVAQPGGDRDLVLAAVLAGQPGAAVGVPGAEAELQPAVVAVSRVRVPVATRLTPGQPVPDPGRDPGPDPDDLGAGLLQDVLLRDVLPDELVVLVDERVGHVADAGPAQPDDLRLARVHRAVLLLDDRRRELLVRHVPLDGPDSDEVRAVVLHRLGRGRDGGRGARQGDRREGPEDRCTHAGEALGVPCLG